MSVLLVRHAHALARSSWTADDHLRVLSDRGRRQASALVPILREHSPKRLISSPYLRCTDTLGPLAAELGLSIEPADELAEGSSGAALRLVRSVMADDVVLCSHGDVIPVVLERLAREDRLTLSKNLRNEKASVWVLQHKKNRFTRGTYIRPPRVEKTIRSDA